MAIYFVSLNINNEDQDYDDLIEAIESYDGYCHIFENQWFICSDAEVDEIEEDLVQNLYEGDFILISEFAGNYAGWLPEEVVDWVERNR